MDNQNGAERSVPVQFVRGSRAFKQFKNPPQPHMCIQDTIKDTMEKLFINVLGWQKIANPKQYTDPIPLYGGMQVPQGCGLNSSRPPLLVFAVMVNPDILKANGKNAANPTDRDALVNLLCDFVEAMNPGLVLTRNPMIMKDRDLAGELKDVWLAVQNKREREKGMTQDVMYKVYDIDGVGTEDASDEDKVISKINSPTSLNKSDERKQMAQSLSSRELQGNSHCSPGRENGKDDMSYQTGQQNSSTHEIQLQLSSQENSLPSTSFRKEWNNSQCKSSEGWAEFSKRDMSSIKNGGNDIKQKVKLENKKQDVQLNNGKAHYDFFPVFDNKTAKDSSNVSKDIIDGKSEVKLKEKDHNSKVIIEPMQKLVLRSTDNKICDNKSSALSSISS